MPRRILFALAVACLTACSTSPTQPVPFPLPTGPFPPAPIDTVTHTVPRN